MNKNVFMMTVAFGCAVATGINVLNTYNASNQLEANILLAENIEALSSNESGHTTCKIPINAEACWANNDSLKYCGMRWSSTTPVPSPMGRCVCLGESCSCPPGSSTRK